MTEIIQNQHHRNNRAAVPASHCQSGTHVATSPSHTCCASGILLCTSAWSPELLEGDEDAPCGSGGGTRCTNVAHLESSACAGCR